MCTPCTISQCIHNPHLEESSDKRLENLEWISCDKIVRRHIILLPGCLLLICHNIFIGAFSYTTQRSDATRTNPRPNGRAGRR